MRAVVRATMAPRTAAAIGAVIVGVAAIAFVARLPAALHDFDERAHVNDQQTFLGRSIAGADAEEIDNDFLVHALALVPAHATYAILRPDTPAVAKTYGIKPATFYALYPFVLNALLPRRQVDPAKAEFLLCYACNTDPFDKRMKRLWENGKGLVIGQLTQ